MRHACITLLPSPIDVVPCYCKESKGENWMAMSGDPELWSVLVVVVKDSRSSGLKLTGWGFPGTAEALPATTGPLVGPIE